MQSHTRALIAAATFAYLAGKKVAGVYDHAEQRDLRIAAEFRGTQLQAFDGERGTNFGGSLPELFDAGDQAYVSFQVEEGQVKGYDRASSTFYSAQLTDGIVQVYDHGQAAWFAYDIQDPDAASSYHRAEQS